MTPVTSLDIHTPVKCPSSKDPLVEGIAKDSNNDEDDIDFINNENNIGNSNYDYIPDPLYKPDFMKMNGTTIRT